MHDSPSAASQLHSVLAGPLCKVVKAGWLKQQLAIFLLSWSLEALKQGLSAWFTVSQRHGPGVRTSRDKAP